MIQKMSNQHKIKFLEEQVSYDRVVQTDTSPEKTLNQIAEEQKAKILFNKDNGLMTSQYICSARTGNISNKGGPSTFIKSKSSNNIWDSNKISKVSQELDSKTKTMQEKAQTSTNKREAENKRMNDLVNVLKSTIQDKASSVSLTGTFNGTNYKVSENNMSIFDNKDFMRLKDKTDGEKVSESVEYKNAQVDDSWRGGGKIVSSKEITKNLFDGLFIKSE